MTALDDFVAEHDRPAAPGGAADLLRARDRGRGGPARARPELAALLDRLESAEGALRAARAASRSALEEQVQHHNAHHADSRQAERTRRALTSTCSRARCSTSTTSRTSCGSSTCSSASRRGEDAQRRKLRDPSRYMAKELRRLRAAPRQPASCRRAPASERRRTPSPTPTWGAIRLDHLEQCLDTIRDGGGRGRPGRVRHRPRRRRRSSCAAYLEAHEMPVPRGVGRRPVRRRPAARRRTATPSCFRPTSTPCATASTASACSTSGSRFLQGAAERRSPRRRSSGSRCCASAASDRGRGRRGARGALRQGRARRASWSSTTTATPDCQEAVDGSAPSAASSSRSSGSTGAAPAGARPSAAEAATPDRRRAPGPAPPAHGTPADRDQGPLGRRRLLQHAARGGAHAPLALPRLPAGHRRPRLRGDRGRERLRPDAAARRGVRPRASAPSSATSTSGEDATPSPAPALNRGIADRRGRAVALMIDGAHVLTPGVLRFGDARPDDLRARGRRRRSSGTSGRASRTRRSPRATTASYEDRLFEQIDWPTDGYRLFDDRPLHRRPRLVRRAVGEQLHLRAARRCSSRSGLMDESFSMPGGGFANLDFFERMATLARRQPGDDPRRGLVPPGARRHDHERRRARRAQRPARLATTSITRSCAGARSTVPASDMHYVGSLPDGGAAHEGAADGRPRVLQARPRRRHRRPAGQADPDARGAADRVRRRVLAQQGVAARRPGSGSWTGTAADRPVRLPGAAGPGQAGLDHRDRHRAAAAGRCSWRRSATCSATARSSRSTTTAVPRLVEHPRITYLRAGSVRRRPRPPRRASSSARVRARLLILGAAKFDDLMQPLRALLAAGPGGLLRGARGHDPERPPGLDRLRPRAASRRRSGSPTAGTSRPTHGSSATRSRSIPAAS